MTWITREELDKISGTIRTLDNMVELAPPTALDFGDVDVYDSNGERLGFIRSDGEGFVFVPAGWNVFE